MKTQRKDAVALAMDWLAQLREEDGAEPPPGDGNLAADSAPPAADWGDAAPAAPSVAGFGDVAPAPPADDFGALAPLPAGDSWHAAAPPAGDSWHDAPPPAGDSWHDAPPPASGSWHDAAPPAGGSWDAFVTFVAPGGDSVDVTAPPAGTTAAVEITERAVIGDELRIPVAWCEMGSCISRYADQAALGEADIRARAVAAGWRADALGRLACPQCQQGDSWFWTAHPAALWDRDTAVAMTTLMAAAVREIAGGAAADGGAGAEPGLIPGGELAAVPAPRPAMARPPGRGRHRGHPAHADRAQ